MFLFSPARPAVPRFFLGEEPDANGDRETKQDECPAARHKVNAGARAADYLKATPGPRSASRNRFFRCVPSRIGKLIGGRAALTLTTARRGPRLV